MPAASFSHAVAVAADARTVWKTLQLADTWKGIGPIEDVWDAVHGADGSLQSYRFSTSAAGRIWEGTARTTAATRGKDMEMALSTREIRGTIAVDLAPAGAGTTVGVTLRAETAGLLASVFWGAVERAIASGFPEQVEGFAAGFTTR